MLDRFDGLGYLVVGAERWDWRDGPPGKCTPMSQLGVTGLNEAIRNS